MIKSSHPRSHQWSRDEVKVMKSRQAPALKLNKVKKTQDNTTKGLNMIVVAGIVVISVIVMAFLLYVMRP